MTELRARQIFEHGGLSVLVVESIEIRRSRTPRGRRAFALVEPAAVVVCRHGEVDAHDMDGKPVDLDRLRQESPTLDAAIRCRDSRQP